MIGMIKLFAPAVTLTFAALVVWIFGRTDTLVACLLLLIALASAVHTHQVIRDFRERHHD